MAWLPLQPWTGRVLKGSTREYGAGRSSPRRAVDPTIVAFLAPQAVAELKVNAIPFMQ